MVMRTEDLIAQLSAAAPPVRRVARPAVRMAQWMAIGLAYVGVVALAMRPRADLALMLRTPSFVLAELSGLAVAGCAAMAALSMVVPGYSAWRRVAAAGVSLMWLSWFLVSATIAGVAAPADVAGWNCLPSMLVFAGVPLMALVMQLQCGAPLAPGRTLLYTALAAGALGDVGARLCHSANTEAHLVYHVLGVLLLAATAIGAAPRLLRWAPR